LKSKQISGKKEGKKEIVGIILLQQGFDLANVSVRRKRRRGIKQKGERGEKTGQFFAKSAYIHIFLSFRSLLMLWFCSWVVDNEILL